MSLHVPWSCSLEIAGWPPNSNGPERVLVAAYMGANSPRIPVSPERSNDVVNSCKVKVGVKTNLHQHSIRTGASKELLVLLQKLH